jgi:hypothetical protein
MAAAEHLFADSLMGLYLVKSIPSSVPGRIFSAVTSVL